jgi:hypothetical protein
MIFALIFIDNISHNAFKLLKTTEDAISILDAAETTIALIELVKNDVGLHPHSHIEKPFFLALSLIILYNNFRHDARTF